MQIDGRIVVVGAFTTILWAISAVGQRRDKSLPRVMVPRIVAVFAGSKDSCVVWRDLAIQVGLIFNFVLYTIVVLVAGRANFATCGFISLLLIVIIQWFHPHTSCSDK